MEMGGSKEDVTIVVASVVVEDNCVKKEDVCCGTEKALQQLSFDDDATRTATNTSSNDSRGICDVTGIVASDNIFLILLSILVYISVFYFLNDFEWESKEYL